MGVQVFGEGSGFRYDAWTGRGPNTNDTSKEQNESGTNIGGKLSYSYDSKDLDMTFAVIGASYSLGNHPANHAANAKKADMAMGAELTLSYKGFTLWSEYGTRDMKDSTDTLKNSMTGYYAIGSYTLGLGSHGELIPFVMVDGLKYKEAVVGELDAKQISRTILGLSYRPVPTITWKLEYENGGSYRPKNADGSLFHIADSNYVEDRVVAQFVYFYN
jgi:hypothetical protein